MPLWSKSLWIIPLKVNCNVYVIFVIADISTGGFVIWEYSCQDIFICIRTAIENMWFIDYFSVYCLKYFLYFPFLPLIKVIARERGILLERPSPYPLTPNLHWWCPWLHYHHHPHQLLKAIRFSVCYLWWCWWFS